MAVVPYRVSGAAADQSLEHRFFQICHIAMQITCDPRASGALRPAAANRPVEGLSADAATSAKPPAGPTQLSTCSGINSNHEREDLDHVGKVVWESGFVLAEFLLRVAPLGQDWRDMCAVDLGTGTGVVGIALALAGVDVVLTDLPHITPMAESNVSANCNGRWHRVSVKPYCWGEEPGILGVSSPDLITGGDIIYQAEHFDALVTSICKLSAPHTVTFISYRERNRTEAEFVSKAEAAGLVVEYVPTHLLHPEYQDGYYHILRLCRVS